jgi:GDP-4-dehydro-6-deoxy-D-mannose reductase
MKALITGISGFSGRHLAKLLQAENLEVTGIDLTAGEYLQADLTDKEAVAKAVNKNNPDYIFHLASPLIRSDQLIDEALTKNLQVDLFGTVNLLEAAANLPQKPKILITGTNAEYQESKGQSINEDHPLRPQTSYGLSKMTQELVAKKLAEAYGLQLVTTRTFHLVGPDQKPGFVVTDWCRQIALIESGKAKPELTVGNLDIERDFTDVRDAVAAYWMLMQKGVSGQSYNVCSGKKNSLRSVLKELQKLSGLKFKVKSVTQKLRDNDPDIIVGNRDKLSKTTGWKPQIDLKTSLTDTLNYWRKEVSA